MEVIGQYVATPPFQTFLIVRMRNRNSSLAELRPVRDFLFDVHFVDLENFQPLARFKVQKFAEVTKFLLGFKCDSYSSAPQTAGGECFYRLNK